MTAKNRCPACNAGPLAARNFGDEVACPGCGEKLRFSVAGFGLMSVEPKEVSRACPRCSGELIPDEKEGEIITCIFCRARVVWNGTEFVEVTKDMATMKMKLVCAGCGGFVPVAGAFKGDTLPCPQCQRMAVVPQIFDPVGSMSWNTLCGGCVLAFLVAGMAGFFLFFGRDSGIAVGVFVFALATALSLLVLAFFFDLVQAVFTAVASSKNVHMFTCPQCGKMAHSAVRCEHCGHRAWLVG